VLQVSEVDYPTERERDGGGGELHDGTHAIASDRCNTL
jgi:hypothetical protein